MRCLEHFRFNLTQGSGGPKARHKPAWVEASIASEGPGYRAEGAKRQRRAITCDRLNRRCPSHRQHQTRLWSQLLQILVADALPSRPGRHEPRAVKKRSKYPRLNKPRHQYRDRWTRGKRRRIAKARKRASLN